MDQRGPLEGAPIVIADPMDLTIIDKVCTDSTWPDDNIVSSSTFCDNPRKLNSKFYFLTVECVEDQARDFGRMYSSLEQISFPTRADSPLSDFEHRVSPHDPNMSSAARYSPTPVALPSSPFNNSEVNLPEPSSPLISTSETSTKITSGYSSQLADQSSTASLPQSENSEDFTDSTSDDLVSSVGNELMLIQAGSSSDLEPSSNPLILGEISGSDITLARDFLIQEDQINVINSIKLSSNLDTEINQIPEAILPVIIDREINGQTSLKNYKKISDIKKISDSCKKNTTWDKNEANEENNLWNEDCDSTCVDMADCTLHSVCTIADQPVPSRAVATLPGLYLSIDKLSSSDDLNGSKEFGVFAKRNIRRRTQFGPIEGILRPYDESPINGLPLLIETEQKNEFLQIDISNENCSNWMRFVRLAKTYEEQNLIICQQNDGIVFLTTRNIMPKEELKAGPSHDYGKRRNLTVLVSKQGNSSEDSNANSCDNPHLTNGDLEIIDDLIQKKTVNGNYLSNCTKSQNKRKTTYNSFQKYLDLDEDEEDDLSSLKIFKNHFKSSFEPEKISKLLEKEKENSLNSSSELMKQEITQSDQADSSEKSVNTISSSIHKCTTCSKCFLTKSKLQQHCLIHDVKKDSLSCYICLKTFLNNSSLSRHLKTHQKDKKALECPICSEAFGMILTLKDYSEIHLNQDETFTCPHCPKSFNSYALARKHARAHHFDRKHECQFCLKSFPAADKLRMHLLKHSDHREFQCAHCGKQFKRKDKLKDHVTRVHYEKKTIKDQVPLNNRAKKTIPKSNPVDCDRFVYKCRRCQVGFKRRGMLVNHLAKRHPDVSPESVPELSLPILRQTRDYYCQYCEKVYKSSSKRKAHIMKNHPGSALPPSNRSKEFDIPGVPNPTFSQAAGSIKTVAQRCTWCHKQYATKAKLLQHQRKKHSDQISPSDKIPRPRCRPPQNQNQPPATSISSNEKPTKSSNDELHEKSEDFQFLKPHFLQLNNSGGESISINNGFELLNPQFARVRDIR